MKETIQTILNSNQYQQFFNDYGWLVILSLIWSIIWKGMALWHSARNDQRGWFITLLIVNTLGILEIIYLLMFRKARMKNS